MFSGILITLWILLVILMLCAGMFLNLLGIAGNWVMLGVMVCHRFLIDPTTRLGIQWGTIGWIILIACVAEAIEFFSGLKGAGQAGASRRALVLSVVGSMIGAGMGLGVGNAVVPILGGIVGVILLGAVGAFAGAVLGETWKGRDPSATWEVGRGAFLGRLIGTVSKAGLGTAILVISLSSLFV